MGKPSYHWIIKQFEYTGHRVWGPIRAQSAASLPSPALNPTSDYLSLTPLGITDVLWDYKFSMCLPECYPKQQPTYYGQRVDNLGNKDK